MTKAEVETLERFGAEFQSKVLSALIQDAIFVQQTYDIVDPNYFESDSRKWITKTILEYFIEYRVLPTPAVFKVEVNKIQSETLKVSVLSELRSVSQHLTDTDLNYIKDKFLQFCKNQTLKSAIIESVDLLEAHQYDEIKILVDGAMRAGSERDFGHDWKEDIEHRLKDKNRQTIETPWQCLNFLMDGGLAAGELGIIAAPSGAGKSWLLTAMGSAALRKGKKVLHITLELNDTYTGLRYDTIFTGIESKKLKDHVDEVMAAVGEVSGKLKIKYFPSYTVNSHNLMAFLQQLEGAGFVPDLLVIDYADLLRSNSKADARYLELGQIYGELRGVAGELQIPCWTASQTQRSSISEEVIQADKIAESYSKIMVADFVISLSRTLNDKQSNTARVHVIKNRFGPDGITFPAEMDVIKGKIEVYEENSTQGIKARQQMDQSDAIVKSVLKKKLQDHQASKLD